jgi:hypothetical protein
MVALDGPGYSAGSTVLLLAVAALMEAPGVGRVIALASYRK